MTFIAVLALLLVLAAPSIQQWGYQMVRDHVYCYGRCNDAYKINANDYRVNECSCNQYNFPGHTNCGHIDQFCVHDNHDPHHQVYVFSYDHKTHTCHRISVFKRCADIYTPQRNIFQHQHECARSCEHNIGH